MAKLRKKALILHLCANNDPNGNPQRVFVAIDTRSGEILETMDEGYRGSVAWRERYPNGVEGPRFYTSKSEYHSLVKFPNGGY